MLYPQNGDRIVTIDSVTSLHPVYTELSDVAKHWTYKLWSTHWRLLNVEELMLVYAGLRFGSFGLRYSPLRGVKVFAPAFTLPILLVDRRAVELFFFKLGVSVFQNLKNVNVMLSNMTFLMIFAVFDPSPLTLWINCSFSINICCFIVKIA